MAKRLAMTADGKLTYCSASEENVGKGRCNHIGHERDGESPEHFSRRMQAEDIVFNLFKGLHYYEDEEIGGIDPKAFGEAYFEASKLRILKSFSSERLREMNSSLSDAELILRGDKKDLERLSKSDNPYSSYLANEVLEGNHPEEFDFEEAEEFPEEEFWASKGMYSSDENARLNSALRFLENDIATFNKD